MKTMKIILAVLLAYNFDAFAQEDNAKYLKNDLEQEPRYMMAEAQDKDFNIKINSKDIDFSWESITSHSLASGEMPKIGSKESRRYYDFKDGLPHPYYIINRN